MNLSSTLGERLRASRRTAAGSLASRNRLFASRALFVLAGGAIVSAMGSSIERLGAQPLADPALLVAAAAGLAGALVATVELARGGGGVGGARRAWCWVALNGTALVAALLLH